MGKKVSDQAVTFISSWLAFRYESEEISGYVVVIAHKNEVVLNQAYGYAYLEKKTQLST